jgi:hypothetical protein
MVRGGMDAKTREEGICSLYFHAKEGCDGMEGRISNGRLDTVQLIDCVFRAGTSFRDTTTLFAKPC